MSDDRANVYFEPSEHYPDGLIVYRASSLGSCSRSLYGARMGMTPLPYPEDLQRRFADGHLHEAAVVNVLTAAGIEVVDDQRELELSIGVSDQSGVVIRGHIDGIVKSPVTATIDGHTIDIPGPAVLEIKSLSQASTEKWLNQGFDAFYKYAVQISIYMLALNMPAVYVVKNKNSGQHHVRVIETPPLTFDELQEMVIRVEDAAVMNTMPACTLADYPCPYFFLHDDEAKKAVDEVVDDPILNSLANEYARLKDAAADIDQKKSEARDDLLAYLRQHGRGSGTVMTADWKVAVSSRSRTSLDRKALEADYPDIPWEKYQKASAYTEVRVDSPNKEKK